MSGQRMFLPSQHLDRAKWTEGLRLGIGEPRPIDLKMRLAGRLALPITGPKVISHGRAKLPLSRRPLTSKRGSPEARPTDHRPQGRITRYREPPPPNWDVNSSLYF